MVVFEKLIYDDIMKETYKKHQIQNFGVRYLLVQILRPLEV